MKILKRAYLAIILLFLYVPIAVLIFQSFNAGVSRAKWEGFSLRWYAQLFQSPNIMEALYVTVSIALLASMFSTHNDPTGHKQSLTPRLYILSAPSSPIL